MLPGTVELVEKVYPQDNGNSSTEQSPGKKPKIDDAAFYGLAGTIARTIDPYSEADPVASLLNTLTAFGNVVGSTPHFFVDKHQTT